jgi:hypothetical protein
MLKELCEYLPHPRLNLYQFFEPEMVAQRTIELIEPNTTMMASSTLHK